MFDSTFDSTSSRKIHGPEDPDIIHYRFVVNDASAHP